MSSLHIWNVWIIPFQYRKQDIRGLIETGTFNRMRCVVYIEIVFYVFGTTAQYCLAEVLSYKKKLNLDNALWKLGIFVMKIEIFLEYF